MAQFKTVAVDIATRDCAVVEGADRTAASSHCGLGCPGGSAPAGLPSYSRAIIAVPGAMSHALCCALLRFDVAAAKHAGVQ